jgi:hypothetical protein
VHFTGQLDLDRFELAIPGAGRVVAWHRALARGLDLSLFPNGLRIEDLKLERAFLETAIDREGRFNLAQLVPGERAGSGERLAIDIRGIALEDATFDYTDESLILPFGTKIHAAHGTIEDLSTTSAAAARVAVEGRVGNHGYVTAGGTLRVADPFASTDLRLTFRDVSMPELTPYVAEFAGYSVQDGQLDLDVLYRIEQRRLVGDHRVMAKDLVLGPKVEGAAGPGLPVRLAIALLKDKEGRIDLAVPVEGSIDSPEFGYRKIFWQALKQILGNLAKAPFRALGRMFGRDEEDLDLVGFVAGRSDLLPPEQETLGKLGPEIGSRAELKVEVTGCFDPLTDTEALRRAGLEARIDARREADLTLEGILEALYAESFSPELLEQERLAHADPAALYDTLRAGLLEAEQVGEARLVELASARAQAIASALTVPGGLEATRVTLVDPVPVKRKKQGSDLVASELTLSVED